MSELRDPMDLLPVLQLVTASGDAAPVFARQALLDRLSRPHRFRIVGHGSGGQILAASGRALAEAQGLLRQAYGASIGFGTPSVHTYVDAHTGMLMVPVVFMRIDAPRARGPELRNLLEERRARMQEVEMRRDRVVLRAEMQLSRTLDLEDRIASSTGGAAQVLSWLVRYEPATPAHATDKKECGA